MKSAFVNEIWFACSSHDLDLVQSHTFDKMKTIADLEEVNALMFHSKELVTFVKRSEIQRELKTNLKQSIDVRWDSRLLLLQSIKSNYEELKNIAEVNDRVEEHLIHINYELLCDLIELLATFHKYSLDLCLTLNQLSIWWSQQNKS